MRQLVCARMFALIGSVAAGGVAAQQRAERLVWSDEFSADAVDADNWEFQIGNGQAVGLPGWGNNELQYYRPDNTTVQNGVMTITAERENFGGFGYTSSRLRSINRFEFAYGRVEASIRLPSTRGIWPAFWMLPTNSPYGTWAASGEIDIMESVNFADRIYGTIHYGAPFPGNVQAGGQYAPGTDFSQDFHTYSLEWDPNQMRWYVDGVLYRVINRNVWFSSAAPGDPRAPFDREFHLILNVAVGGNFPGNPDGSSQFPQSMEIDWVRVYQLERQPFGGTPAVIPGRIEAENFDEGYPGEVYFETDVVNNGGAYRPDEDVDIEATTGGGFNVGWIGFGEWIEYTVNVERAGDYTVTARVSSESSGGAFSLQQDEFPIGSLAQVPVTGGFQEWAEIEFPVTLDAGVQTIRFQNFSFPGQEFNLDWLEFNAITSDCLADTNGDGALTPADFNAWVIAFNAGDPSADQNGDGLLSPADFNSWVLNYNAGCS
ncbi:MAG: family 16 glycosylhydrolase [Planctomycetota bacterium]